MRTRFRAYGPAASAAVLSVLCLAACDGAPSANPARAHAGGAADRRLADAAPDGADVRAPARYANATYSTSGAASAREAETPLFHGKPMWAANKKHSAQENADYHFKRDGEAVDAKSEDDFLTKVHAFVDTPPKGTETLTRSNGDKLMYDAKANLFAVVDKDGAPRTLFKPRDGATYWQQQKDSVAKGDDDYRSGSRSTRKSARRSSGDDNG